MRNIVVNPTVETGPLTRWRFMGVAAMLAPGLCAMGPEGTAPPEAGTMFGAIFLILFLGIAVPWASLLWAK